MLWLFGIEEFKLIGFALCGLGYALFNGAIRSRFNHVLNQNPNISTTDGWAWLFQLSLVCSATGFAVNSVFFYLGGSVSILILGLIVTSVLLTASSLYGDRCILTNE